MLSTLWNILRIIIVAFLCFTIPSPSVARMLSDCSSSPPTMPTMANSSFVLQFHIPSVTDTTWIQSTVCPAISTALPDENCCCRVTYDPTTGAYVRVDVLNEDVDDLETFVTNNLDEFTTSAKLPCNTTITALSSTATWRYLASKTTCLGGAKKSSSTSICGNGICEAKFDGSGETCISCPEDCRMNVAKGLCCGTTSSEFSTTPCPLPQCFKQNVSCVY